MEDSYIENLKSNEVIFYEILLESLKLDFSSSYIKNLSNQKFLIAF
ncbi:hypothetical protein cco112_06164 [Campylobacter coli 2685]|nr:hypothetical protein cco10_07984 [Campylobacter coli 90-3]EIA48818.1 hypothetical protein cco111_01150 [Campylobacter coli 2680]EIA52237.1 hypothetical protein cco112_06164 [Campylobacter coli 2685]EIA56442.1 hypothetical protein cco113_02270 [Campylobacter coli 2688]EIA61957.1 hypothetical protein cco16_02943 [Campylobacter coli 86119]EIA66842.1 hypothetical protein cco23_04125 [Campylobacter coli 1098]EIA71972.1 hypothetical protein cco37_00845 [Campylobacter coli 1417]EIA87578.1 hypoth